MENRPDDACVGRFGPAQNYDFYANNGFIGSIPGVGRFSITTIITTTIMMAITVVTMTMTMTMITIMTIIGTMAATTASFGIMAAITTHTLVDLRARRARAVLPRRLAEQKPRGDSNSGGPLGPKFRDHFKGDEFGRVPSRRWFTGTEQRFLRRREIRWPSLRRRCEKRASASDEFTAEPAASEQPAAK